MRVSCTTCLELLTDVRKNLSKKAGYTAAPFLEPPALFEDWLYNNIQTSTATSQQDWISALWLSDLARSGRPGNGWCMSTKDAKGFTEEMVKSKERATQMLTGSHKTAFVMWAPGRLNAATGS